MTLPLYDPKKRKPLEKDIERKIVQYAKTLGCRCYKFTSPAHRSVPDRIILTPHGVVGFLEVKRPGGKPTEAQAHEMQSMADKNAMVVWADSFEKAKQFIDVLMQQRIVDDRLLA
jgi:hypothetical protein